MAGVGPQQTLSSLPVPLFGRQRREFAAKLHRRHENGSNGTQRCLTISQAACSITEICVDKGWELKFRFPEFQGHSVEIERTC